MSNFAPDEDLFTMIVGTGGVVARANGDTFHLRLDSEYAEALGVEGVAERGLCATSDVSRLKIVHGTVIDIKGRKLRVQSIKNTDGLSRIDLVN